MVVVVEASRARGTRPWAEARSSGTEGNYQAFAGLPDLPSCCYFRRVLAPTGQSDQVNSAWPRRALSCPPSVLALSWPHLPPPPRLLVKTKGKHACRARRLLRRRPAPACPWPCQCPAKGIRIHNPALYAPLGQTLQLKLGQPVVPRVDCATHVIPWFRKDSSPPKVQTSAVQTGVSEAAVQRAPPMLPQHLYTPGTSCANTTRAARREPALLEQHTARPAPDNRLSTASAQESSSVHAPARVRCCHSSKRHSASHPSKCPVHLASTHTTVAFVPELKPY